MRFIIAGSIDWEEPVAVQACLIRVHKLSIANERPFLCIVSNDTGPSTVAYGWCDRRGWGVKPVPINFAAGREARILNNLDLLNAVEARIEYLFLFSALPLNPNLTDLLVRARGRGIPAWIYGEPWPFTPAMRPHRVPMPRRVEAADAN